VDEMSSTGLKNRRVATWLKNSSLASLVKLCQSSENFKSFLY